MINFKPLELCDRELFSGYLKEYNFNTYEYSFPTLYIWRKMCNTEFSIVDNALVVKKHTPNVGAYFMQPIGANTSNMVSITSKLYNLRKKNPDFKYLFGDVETPFLSQLHESFNEAVSYSEDVNNYDYIYSCKDLISLSGRKYHRKKNQYNQFVNNYDYKIKEILSDEVIKDCMHLSITWFERKSDNSGQLNFELQCIEDILNNIELFNVKGIAVYVNNKIVGFAIGEKANSKMAVVHFEKGDLDFSGIYPFLNKTLVESCFSDVDYINLQEDLGLKGLIRAKSAYQPIKLEKKYLVNIGL